MFLLARSIDTIRGVGARPLQHVEVAVPGRMGQTISSSFVWKRDLATDGEEDDDSCDDALDAAPFVSIPIELANGAKRPTRATSEAVGFDLCASESMTVPPNNQYVKIHTGVKMAISAPAVKKRLGADTVVYGAIRARSGLTSRGIDVFHGTIDADYRGEIIVLIRNSTNAEFDIEPGDKIAQLIFSVALISALIEYENIETVFETARGKGGFGSTGMQNTATDASAEADAAGADAAGADAVDARV